jgi:hypothetical protein
VTDLNFWIGAVLGFLGALLGGLVASWAQYKYKIEELKYIAKQESIKREEEERAREEAERNKLRDLIMDLSNDIDGRDRWEFMSKYTNHLRAGRRHSRALSWYMGNEHDRGRLLNAMDVTELRVLYTGLLTIPIVSTVSEAKEEELNRKLRELIEKMQTFTHITGGQPTPSADG